MKTNNLISHPTFIKFRNSSDEMISFEPGWKILQNYKYCEKFIEVEDGIIIILRPHESNLEKVDDEILRKNIVKINENGEILWTVEDPRRHIKTLNGRSTFDSIELHDNKNFVVKLNDGTAFFLDPATGELGVGIDDLNIKRIKIKHENNNFSNINQGRTFLTFSNSDNELIKFDPKRLGYDVINFMLVLKDKMILGLDVYVHDISNPAKMRQNVFAIDQKGKVLWNVDDYKKIWDRKFKVKISHRIIAKFYLMSKGISKYKFDKPVIPRAPLDVIFYSEEGEIVLGCSNGPEYFLNSDTGEITYWRTVK